MMKIRNDILAGAASGIFRAYPLLDDRGKSLWPGKFPNNDSTKELQSKLSQEAWAKEYMLSLGQDYHYDKSEKVRLICGVTDDSLMRPYFHKKHLELEIKYKKYFVNDIHQTNLIKQMKGYKISAPHSEEIIIPDQDDPRYDKYLEYNKRKIELASQFRECLHKNIVRRAREKEKNNLDKKDGSY